MAFWDWLIQDTYLMRRILRLTAWRGAQCLVKMAAAENTLKVMDLENRLRIVRIQIRHGRIEAHASLTSLLLEYQNTTYEPLILEIFALEDLYNRKCYEEAIPLLTRLLSLNIGKELRQRAKSFLDLCEAKINLGPSEPDATNKDFVEFMDVVRKRKIFEFSNDLIEQDYVIIKDLDKAKEIAWHQEIGFPFESWNDLRTQASKDVHSFCYDNKIRFERVYKRVCLEVSDLCDECIPSALMHFYDDIFGDLTEIARGKLVGFNADLHQKMWAAYKERSFPCGWEGEYPSGRLCVYVP
jgi:hypothetical protein